MSFEMVILSLIFGSMMGRDEKERNTAPPFYALLNLQNQHILALTNDMHRKARALRLVMIINI